MKNQNTQKRKSSPTMPFSIGTLIIGIYLIFGSCLMGFSQNVGINTNNPDNSALLEVSSTDKGVLIPRLTNAERNDIPAPATGLIVYNSDTEKFNFWDGDSWEELNDSFVSSVVGSGTAGDGGVSMNATGNDPDPSAMLDIASDGTDKKGLLMPRTTTGSVSVPAEGLMLYNTGTDMFSFYDGTAWQNFCHENISTTTGSGTFTSTGTGINITNTDPSAMVEMASTSRGFLIPRLSEIQRDDIIAPANGLMIYNTTDKSIDFYTGTEWRQLMYDVPAQPGAISGNTTLCENANSETYSISVVNGASFYTWTVPAGANITSGQGTTGITVDFGSGSGDICVTADNGCGASTQSCQAISVNSPTANAGSNSSVCEGDDINLTESGGDATSWNWDGPDSFSSTAQNPTISSATTAADGTYTVTVTDGIGCTASDNITVTVNSVPIADAGSDVSICNGNSTTIDASGSSGTATLSYSWDNGLGAGASHTVSPSSTTTYTVTVTDGNGCTNTDNVRVTVNPTPTATAGSNSPVCEGEDIDLTESGGDATAWNWDGPDSFSSNSQNPTISSATTAADGTYTVTVTDGNGCTNTDNVSVTVNTAPSTPTAGTHVPGEEQIEWNWTTVSDADGYKYNTVDDYGTATDNGTSTSYTQTGLNCETAYTLYVWAYNSCGESGMLTLNEITSDCPFTCGSSTVDDIDGNTYNTVEIGSQCWMQENMATTRYADGTSIPLVDNSTDWDNLTETDKAYCWYNDDQATYGATYGALYTWAAATSNTYSSTNPSGVQGICPDGWHVPSDDEWKELEMELGMSQIQADDEGWRGTNEGSKLAGNSALWYDHNLEYDSDFGSSGFLALPGGYRNPSGSFLNLTGGAVWWVTLIRNSEDGYYRKIINQDTTIMRYYYHKYCGYSVRCIKD